jgi:hypothetical protein
VHRDIGSTHLPAKGHRELLAIGGKMAESIDRRRGAMRDDPLFCSTTPHGDLRGKLEPGRPEFKVIRHRTSSYAVDTMGDSLEERTWRSQANQRSCRYAGLFDLATGDESPLLSSDLGDF